MASELLKRSEVKEADTWNVKDMYPTTEAWENELKIITGIVDKIASYEGNVKIS
jgi:oligoendopeptidase F